MHRDPFFDSLHEIAISVEKSRDHSELVVIPPLRFPQVQAPDIDAGEHGEFRLEIAGLEELRLEFDGKAVDFFLGEDCPFNLLLGLLRRISGVLGGKVATARLDFELLRIFERYFQAMEAAVEFQVLRSETKNVGVFGSRGGAPEAFVVVVTVLKKTPPVPSASMARISESAAAS